MVNAFEGSFLLPQLRPAFSLPTMAHAPARDPEHAPARDPELLTVGDVRSRVLSVAANVRDLASAELTRVADNHLVDYNARNLQNLITRSCTVSVRDRRTMAAGINNEASRASLVEMAESLRNMARALNVESLVINELL